MWDAMTGFRISFITIFTVFCFIGASGGNVKTFHLSELCPNLVDSAELVLGSTYESVNSSLILKATPNGRYYTWYVRCRVRIRAPPGHHILAAMRKIDFRSDCIDNLTLSDSYAIHKKYVYCGKGWDTEERNNKTFIENLIVDFSTGSILDGSVYGYDGFQLTVTTYRDEPCRKSSEFRCSNNRCIAKVLQCDDHNHCGDRSDQLDCDEERLTPSCLPGQYKCVNGRCISSRYMCDGENDCGDWSDEIQCDGLRRITANTVLTSIEITFIAFSTLILLLAVVLVILLVRWRKRKATTAKRSPVPDTGLQTTTTAKASMTPQITTVCSNNPNEMTLRLQLSNNR